MENHSTEKSGVVSAEDLNGWIWKEPIELVNTIVSEHGHVAHRTGITEWTYITSKTAPKWLAAYLVVRVKFRTGGYKNVLLHVLVTLAFYGRVDNWETYKIVANHRDGDKRNNHYTNLEWCTRGENQIHAYKTGLRTDNCRITVVDNIAGTSVDYYSIAEFGRVFNLSKTQAATVSQNHRDELYLGRYLITRNEETKVTNKKAWVKTIYAINYRTMEFHTATDAAKMAYISGVRQMTILYNLRMNRTSLVNGWVFTYSDVIDAFPTYSPEDIELSITQWATKTQSREKKFGVEVKNYVTNEVTQYATMEDAAVTGIGKSVISYVLLQDKPKLIKALVCRYPSDDPWPVYTPEKVIASSKYHKECTTVYEIKDHEQNTTDWFPTIRSFALAYDYAPVAVANHVRLKPGELYKSRFSITNITSSPNA